MTNYKPFKIIIAGAGAAGYVAAAAIRKNLPHIDVTIVHDPKIPHIGVGETLAWNAAPFIKNVLGLKDDHDWMIDSQSSYKFSVRHTGWLNGRPDDHLYTYYWWNPQASAFDSSIVSAYDGLRKNQVLFNGRPVPQSPLEQYSAWDVWLHLYKKGLRKAEDRYGDLAELYWFTQYNTMPWDEDHRSATDPFGFSYTYNINADYFKQTIHRLVGEPNGVKVIPVPIREVKMNGEDIGSIVLEDGSEHTADIYIDSTGFSRILAKKVPSFKWVECDEYFNNASLVGQATYPETGHPEYNFMQFHTMKYGWVFSIPFSNRSGDGYQFNRNIYSNQDEIVRDYEQRFPERKDVITRLLTWDPGHYDKMFSNNCILLGITHGFMDVFDANNFSSNITYISRLINHLKDDVGAEFGWKDEFNNSVNSIVEDIKQRIQTCFHVSPRNDTVYWQTMKEAERKFNTTNRLLYGIFDRRRRRYKTKPSDIFFAQGQYANHSIHYGLDIKPPVLKIDERSEQLALNFFKFFNEKNRIAAQHAMPVSEFYKKFYGR